MLNLFVDVAQTNPPAPPAEPYGSAKDDAIAGDGSGTPVLADLIQDFYGSAYALLGAANITPSSTVENAVNSDILNAINYLVGGSHSLVPLSGSTPVILLQSAINTTFEVDLTAGIGLDVTLPLSTQWNNGDFIKFRIVGADAGENRRLRILGSGGENISSLSSHDFYFVNSWVIIRKYDGGLQIDDYNDAKSLIFKAYFADGQSQVLPNDTTIIYPSINLNKGSFYNVLNGQATMKIPGEWFFNYSARSDISTSSPVNIYSYITTSLPSAGLGIDGYARFDWNNNRNPFCGKDFTYYTQNIDDVIEIRGFGLNTIQASIERTPGFSGVLLERFI